MERFNRDERIFLFISSTRYALCSPRLAASLTLCAVRAASASTSLAATRSSSTTRTGTPVRAPRAFSPTAPHAPLRSDGPASTRPLSPHRTDARGQDLPSHFRTHHRREHPQKKQAEAPAAEDRHEPRQLHHRLLRLYRLAVPLRADRCPALPAHPPPRSLIAESNKGERINEAKLKNFVRARALLHSLALTAMCCRRTCAQRMCRRRWRRWRMRRT